METRRVAREEISAKTANPIPHLRFLKLRYFGVRVEKGTGSVHVLGMNRSFWLRTVPVPFLRGRCGAVGRRKTGTGTNAAKTWERCATIYTPQLSQSLFFDSTNEMRNFKTYASGYLFQRAVIPGFPRPKLSKEPIP